MGKGAVEGEADRLSWGTEEQLAHLRASGSQPRLGRGPEGVRDTGLQEPRFEGESLPYLWGASSIVVKADLPSQPSKVWSRSRLGTWQTWGLWDGRVGEGGAGRKEVSLASLSLGRREVTLI